jgi:hypothetical protein
LQPDQVYEKNDYVPYFIDMEETLFKRPFGNLPVGGDRTMSKRIPGVSTSFLNFGLVHCISFHVLIFIGTPYAPFTLHVEDKVLSSINFGHYGAHKVWYGVAQKDYRDVVVLLNKFVFFSLILCS